jgi:signal transduction histidine kinase
MSGAVHRSARRVMDLLENLLQWSRIQMGRMPYEPKALVLSQIVDQNVKLLMVNATKKNIILSSQITTDLSIYVDEYMIHTIFRNLISNAIKFTPPGGQVTVSARIGYGEQDQQDISFFYYPFFASFVEVSISDTGVGISEKDIGNLFQIEVHHSTIGTAQEKGTGLGLIMCYEMVKRNGGEIWVESELGKGTVVKLSLPLVH